jgi:NADH-quinone oxidoreductase subunit M
MTWRERLIMAPLLAFIVFLGVYPKPVLDRVGPTVTALVKHVEAHSDYREPRVTVGGRTAAATRAGRGK